MFGETWPLPEVKSGIAGLMSLMKKTQPRAPCEDPVGRKTIPITQKISQEGTNVGTRD